MARVTSKRQVTIPKAIADRYGIRPGCEIEWLPSGEAIRVVPPTDSAQVHEPSRRLGLFDRATERQRSREGSQGGRDGDDRGWTREKLYRRGIPG